MYYPALYAAVTGLRHRRWLDFLWRHSHIVVVFQWCSRCRVRWVGHTNWVDGDARLASEQSSARGHVLYMLSLFLRQWQGEAKTVDDFIESYPYLPGNCVERDRTPIIPLPRRGDLVRLIRQHGHLFLYNSDTFQIHRVTVLLYI